MKVTFPEAVSGFVAGDLRASAGTLSGFAAATGDDAGKVWTATLAPPADGEGTITLGIANGAATSVATGNASAGATLDVAYDTQRPTATIVAGGDALSADDVLNKGERANVTVTFSEPVTGFFENELAKSEPGASLTRTAGTPHDGFGTTHVYNLSPPITGSGTITLRVAADAATDRADNGNAAATDVTVKYDNTVLAAPTGLAAVPGDDEPATSLKATWDVVPDATGYELQWKATNALSDETFSSYVNHGRFRLLTGNGSTSHTVTGLVTGSVHAFRVRATKEESGIDGPWSGETEGSPYAGPLDIVLSGTSLTVCEDPDDGVSCPGGQSNTYTVRLNTPPEGDVSVRVLEDSPRLSAAPSRLAFTPADWSVPRTVTVTGTVDDIAWGEDGKTVVIRHLRAGGGRRTGVSRHRVTATVHDDDTASVIVDTDPDTPGAQHALTVTEGGTATYTVEITSQPRGRETVTVLGTVEVDGERRFSSGRNDLPARLNGGDTLVLGFTAQDWKGPRTVTVRGMGDGRIAGDRRATVRHEAGAGSYYRDRSDPERERMEVADVALTVAEGDAADTFRWFLHECGAVTGPPGARRSCLLSLRTPPTHDVTLTLASSDPDVATVGIDGMPFTPEDHWRPRNVRVRGVSDGTATVTVAAVTSGDGAFQAMQGARVADVRICTGVSYAGGVPRCPGDDGYQSQGSEPEAPPNAPPSFADRETALAATVGAAFSWQVPEATDPEGGVLAYAAELAGGAPLPGWLAFDVETRTLSGTPGAEDALAEYGIAVWAMDDGDPPLAASMAVTLTVAAGDEGADGPNAAPAFAQAPAGLTATEGEAF
ncbi:MAG: Ig-like domain-containing protein, partial [bacterium]|nr:Ig-like domain-containing protein [bacterium]